MSICFCATYCTLSKNKAILEEMGWRVLYIWECQLKKPVREENLEKLYISIKEKESAQL